MRAVRFFLVICALLFGGAANAQAPLQFQSPVLIADLQQIYLRSAFGVRLEQERAAAWATLDEENARIGKELEAEELRLTTERASLSPEEFRDKADAFDAKARETRQIQREKAIALQQQSDKIPAEFIAAISPIMEGIMRETGALVVLDKRNSLWSANVVDITDEAVRRIDAQIGDGQDLVAE